MRALKVTVGIVVVLGGCSVPTSADGGNMVRKFHAAFNAGQLDSIVAMTNPSFREASAPVKFKSFMRNVRQKLGTVVNSNQVSWRSNVGLRGSTLVLQYRTTFAHGRGNETFVFVGPADKLMLNGYNIQSDDLI